MATTTTYPAPRPRVGQTYHLAGTLCRIVAVHDFGTMDVEMPNGKCFRVTGLPWI